MKGSSFELQDKHLINPNVSLIYYRQCCIVKLGNKRRPKLTKILNTIKSYLQHCSNKKFKKEQSLWHLKTQQITEIFGSHLYILPMYVIWRYAQHIYFLISASKQMLKKILLKPESFFSWNHLSIKFYFISIKWYFCRADDQTLKRLT